MKSLTLFAMLALVSSSSMTAVTANATSLASVEGIEVQQLESDARATLDLDSLKSATELDASMETDSVIAYHHGGGYYPRPRPYPRPFPRPFPHPVPRPAYLTCYAEDAYGRIFSSAGYHFSSELEAAAMRACVYNSNYGCRPRGCR